MSQMIALRLGGVPVMRVRRCLNRLAAAGWAVQPADLATCHLAKGDIDALTDALVEAKTSGIPATFEQLLAIGISIGWRGGEYRSPRDVVLAARTPRSIRLPARGSFEFASPARYTWRPWAEVTVVLQLDRFVGGAGIDRIASQLQAALGVIYDESPDIFSARAKAARLDVALIAKDTKFRVVAVNVSD
jgi:uncharacterized protein YqfA (UPF0365 family)